MAAACRGLSHERSGLRLQDAQSCSRTTFGDQDLFIAVVSDGAGSASHGGQGASLVCRSISLAARRHFSSSPLFPTDTNVQSWLDDARDRIFAVAQRRGLAPRDFAATLVSAISDGNETLIIHVGDGSVVVRDEPSGQWMAPTWPDHGEYASTTSFVTDDGALQLRITRWSTAIDAVALFSDGIERLALDFLAKKPFAGFFDGIFRPVLQSSRNGRDTVLSSQLKRFLGSPAVNERTDDDKTLILAIRK